VQYTPPALTSTKSAVTTVTFDWLSNPPSSFLTQGSSTVSPAGAGGNSLTVSGIPPPTGTVSLPSTLVTAPGIATPFSTETETAAGITAPGLSVSKTMPTVQTTTLAGSSGPPVVTSSASTFRQVGAGLVAQMLLTVVGLSTLVVSMHVV